MRAYLVSLPLLALTVPALATEDAGGVLDKAKFIALQKGMTKPDVVAAVGEPWSVMSDGAVFLYRYTSPSGESGKQHIDVVTVIFDKDDKLAIVSYYSNK